MIYLGAIVMGIVASFLLYLSWRRHSRLFALSGWGGLLAALPLWIILLGVEYGTIFALSLPALYVWVFIAKEQKWQAHNAITSRKYQHLKLNWRDALSGVSKILYLLPILMIVSTLITLSVVRLLPDTTVNQIAVSIIILPLIWGALACWFFTARNIRIQLIFNTLATLVCGLYLFS